MKFIAAHLREPGFVNRRDLTQEFKISIQQASKDLQTYQRLHPRAMSYNRNTKRYERSP